MALGGSTIPVKQRPADPVSFPVQVCHLGGQEEAGHPSRQRGPASEAQRPDPAWRDHAERHRALPCHRPATETGTAGLVSVSFRLAPGGKVGNSTALELKAANVSPPQGSCGGCVRAGACLAVQGLAVAAARRFPR